MIGLIIVILFYIFYNIKLNSYENFESLNKVPLIERPNNWPRLTFNEKLRIYGAGLNENHSIYADKLRIKEVIKKFNIPDLHHSKLIKVLDKNNDSLNLQELPKNCIIKTNNGWNDIIIVENGNIKLMFARGRKMIPQIENYGPWKRKALSKFVKDREQQYQYIDPEVFVEEHLGNNLSDYKFFCIHGKFKVGILMKGRFKKVCDYYFDRDLNKLNISGLGGPAHGNCKYYNFIKNEKNQIKRMIEMSEKISSLFEFARIDFYLINDKIYFGEITFTPVACGVNLKPQSLNKKYGLEWV